MDPDHVPVLVLNGSLDSLTPAAGGAHVARQIGASARTPTSLPNNVHLVALDPRRAVRGPGGAALHRRAARPGCERGACGGSRRSARSRSSRAALARTTPARGHASLRTRRLARIAVAAAGDALIRFDYVDGYADLGLRGGRIRYDHAGDERLIGLRWTRDTTVSGRVSLTTRGHEACSR